MVESGARLELSVAKMKDVEMAVLDFINQNSKEIAQKIKADAKAGTGRVRHNYARGVKAIKSKYEDGGHIVMATAPHSFLVEYGSPGSVIPAKRVPTEKAQKIKFGKPWVYKSKTDGNYYSAKRYPADPNSPAQYYYVEPMPALAPLRKALKKNIGFARQQFAQGKIDFEK